jgi:threonine/homoserine/homoserine lactone efflux protein
MKIAAVLFAAAVVLMILGASLGRGYEWLVALGLIVLVAAFVAGFVALARAVARRLSRSRPQRTSER